jgi:hypothetical protein
MRITFCHEPLAPLRIDQLAKIVASFLGHSMEILRNEIYRYNYSMDATSTELGAANQSIRRTRPATKTRGG